MKNRRDFLKTAGVVSVGFLGLQRLSHAHAGATGSGTSVSSQLPMKQIPGYGPLEADPNGIFDLPKGFSYQILARQGEVMDDGFLVPGNQDGMAAFPLTDGRIALICNHESKPTEADLGPYGSDNALFSQRPPKSIYDLGTGGLRMQGGTTTLIYNPKTRRVDLRYLSLAGTVDNCAGGPTPWNSWITCEETVLRAGEVALKDHGYNFEVPASASVRYAEPIPLTDMGRFNHEAIAVEPRSSIVYQTEDRWDGLIYRFLPHQKGQLARGGRLQAMTIREIPSADTRNWPDTGQPLFPGRRFFDVSWIDMDGIHSPDDDLRYRGFDRGAARFARGEGMWYGHGEVYFACTNGGPIRQGQVFRYIPSPYEGTARESEIPGRLELFVESTNPDILKNCDNLTVAPNGHLYICEDADPPCKLVGITPDGSFFEFGRNAYTDAELAGACFSPAGDVLFVNLQQNGQTLAITGPWDHFQA